MTAGEKAAMHCMHCGKKLPLLRKFNGGEFCSEQHRIAYAKEADRLALRRLIETPASPSRSLKQTPANKSFQDTLHERPKNPPVHAWLFPLQLSNARSG